MRAPSPGPVVAAAALLLLLAACGGGEREGASSSGNAAEDVAAPSDTGLNPSVTVDTQRLPGDTVGRAP